MARLVRVVVVALAGGLLLAQVVPVTRLNPPVTADVAAPPAVAALLRHACYDCHSHETVWPWYAHVAPMSWLVAHDVREGRREIDFSSWDVYSPLQKKKKLQRAVKEMAEGDMPPWYYRVMHPEARLDAAQQEAVRTWATTEAGRLSR
jgi:hypothetical protein